MSRAIQIGLLAILLVCAPERGFAVSAVFDGDPVDPATGLPYEMLPGFPLVTPGPDGLFGTADDTIDPTITGDIDLVVRSGSPAATATIPPPTAQGGRTALPVGVAGPSTSGGTEIPFTVFLSDGATSGAAPSGHLLAAADMDGLPVLVAAFADLDGDGFVGITNQDAGGSADNSLEVRELEPVGRAVALLSGGVARGSVAIRAGLPTSHGGLTIALTAMALTGTFDPGFFDGNVPNGPAITTAQPFVPQSDLTRLIRDRAAPVGPDTTLQPILQFGAFPPAAALQLFALPLDGSSPTIDAALVDAQPATRVAFLSDPGVPALRGAVGDLVLGTRSPENRRRLRVVAVDRWGNATDPPPGFAVTVRATSPLRIQPHRATLKPVVIDSSNGAPISVKGPGRTGDGTTGVLTVERDGVVIGTLGYRVDGRLGGRADLTVPSPGVSTIQAAIASVSDLNHDGALVIDVKAGLYRENLLINRPVTLRGDDGETTVVEGDGTAGTIRVTAPNVSLWGLTAVGGASGFALESTSALVDGSRAWRNLGAGIVVSGAGAQVSGAEVLENAGDGLLVDGAPGAVCSGSGFFDNGGAGINVRNAQGGEIDANRVANNGNDGITLQTTTSAGLGGNRSVANVGSGISLLNGQGNTSTDNLCAINGEEGLHMDGTQQTLASRNVLVSNHGYGLFLRRSTNDDFSADPGLQAPLGDNTASDNRKGDLIIN